MALQLLTKYGLTRQANAPATAPTVEITSPADGANVESPASIQGTITDDVGVTEWWYTVNGGDPQSFVGLVPPEALPVDGNGFPWNSSAFIQDNITTADGVQYVVWVSDAKKPMIAKRTLPAGSWSSFDLSTISGNPLGAPVLDGHNTYSLAVDSDGHIHVSGNMHNTALKYIRSTNAGDITAWTAPGMVGSEETSATYPKFVTLPDGTLLFFYRSGSSSAGDTILNEYNPTTDTWSRVATLIDGDDSGESAYLWHVAVDWSTGDIHLFYCWRDAGGAAFNSDLSYAKSEDGGGTWKKSDGTSLTLPLTHSTSEVIVDTAASGSGLINQCGAEVDESGRPHAAYWLKDGSGFTQMHHIYFDGSNWQTSQISSWTYAYDPEGASAGALARPSVFTTGDRTFIAYRHDVEAPGEYRCVEVTPGGGTTDFLLLKATTGVYELTFDTRALKERNELHFLYSPGTLNDEAVDAGVISVDLDDIDDLVSGVFAYAA